MWQNFVAEYVFKIARTAFFGRFARAFLGDRCAYGVLTDRTKNVIGQTTILVNK